MIKDYLTYIKENNSSDIRVGDKVICIKADGDLILGKMYTITKLYSDYIDRDLCGVDGNNGWLLNRFILADPEIIKKREEERKKEMLMHVDVDPYGEEDWRQNEGIKWYKKGEFEEDPNPHEEIKDYDDFITDDEFREFLINNNCYEEYIEFCHVRDSGRFERLLYNSERRSIIDNTLSWSSTKSGHNFWSNMNDKWNIIIQKSKNKDNFW